MQELVRAIESTCVESEIPASIVLDGENCVADRLCEAAKDYFAYRASSPPAILETPPKSDPTTRTISSTTLPTTKTSSPTLLSELSGIARAPVNTYARRRPTDQFAATAIFAAKTGHTRRILYRRRERQIAEDERQFKGTPSS